MAGSPPLSGNGGRESALQGAPGDGRRLGPNQVARLDGRAMEAVLAFVGEAAGAIPSTILGKPRPTKVTGDVRGRSRSVIGEDNAPVGRAPVKGRPDASLLERGRGETPCRDRLKLVPRRQARGRPGSDCRKMVRRHAGRTLVGIRGLGSGSGKREGLRGQRDASRALGNRAVYGCSYRESIAEVGEKHLVRAS